MADRDQEQAPSRAGWKLWKQRPDDVERPGGQAVLSGVFADREARWRDTPIGLHFRSSHWTELCLVPTAAS